jgi:hypothetical protein
MAVFAGSLFGALDYPNMRPSEWLGDVVVHFVRQEANDKSDPRNRPFTAAAISPMAPGPIADVNTTGSTRLSATKTENTSRNEVLWLFEQPSSTSLFALTPNDDGARVNGFLISGQNTSDQRLTEVQGVLKPDSGGGLELKLSLSGNPTHQGEQSIPPGAQFSLAYVFSKSEAVNGFVEKFGGAIFTFHYTHAGTQKALIHYFSASRFKRDLQNVEATPSSAF